MSPIVPIQILICTANIGNAEPTPSSFAAWIPNDGSIREVVKDDDTHHEKDVFDVIVLGMQEAAFQVEEDESSSSSSSSSSNSSSPSSSAAGSNAEKKENKKKEKSSRDKENENNETATDLVQGVVKAKSEIENLGAKAMSPVSKTGKKVTSQIRSATADQDHTKTKSIESENSTGPVIGMNQLFSKSNDSSVGEGRGGDDLEGLGGDTKLFFQLLQDRCPSYQRIVSYLRGEMRLIILVRKDMIAEVTDVDYRARNTGMGTVLANKGGIVATLTIRGTRLGFITAHMEAHEGKDHYENRNTNTIDILNGAKVGPKPRLYDASIYNHHCFYMGDMNYRISLPGEYESHEKHVNDVLSLIEKKDWDTLNGADELGRALRFQECLVGFQTVPCNFNPTFKMQREDGYVYNPQRTPSYTDRILWKSLDGLHDKLKPLIYEPCPEFITSDHKPIRGAFSVYTNSLPSSLLEPVPERMSFRTPLSTTALSASTVAATTESVLTKHAAAAVTAAAAAAAADSTIDEERSYESLHVFISNIECSNLTAMDPDGLSDPYIVFVTNPVELVLTDNATKNFIDAFFDTANKNKINRKQLKKYPHTKTQRNTINPKFENEEIKLDVRNVKKFSDLIGAFLYITVMDKDVSEDDIIGTVALNLHKTCTGLASSAVGPDEAQKDDDDDDDDDDGMYNAKIREPVLKDGKIQGHLTCDITAWWMEVAGGGLVASSKALHEQKKALKKKKKKMKNKDDACSVM